MNKKYKLVQILKKYKLRSFYLQLLVMVVTLTAVFAAVSIALLYYLRGTMIEREREAQEINLKYSVEQFNSVIDKSYQAINSIIGNRSVVDKLFHYDRNIQSYEDNKEITDVISKLYIVYIADKNIKNVFIAQEKYDFVIDQNGVTNQALYLEKYFGGQAAAWQELVKERHRFTLRMNEDGSSIYVLQSIYSGNVKFATLCMEININKLQDMETFRQFIKDRIVCITDSEMNIIGYLSEKRDDNLIHLAIKNNNVNGYLVLNGGTSTKELNIIALTPIEMITGEVKISLAISLIIIAVTMFLGIIISFCIAGRIYRPLYNAADLIVTAGNRSGDNEFAVIEHNVNAILENNRTMTELVTRSTPMILESVFRKLIEDPESEKGLEDMLSTLSIELRDGDYMAVVIYADPVNDDIEEAIKRFFTDGVVSVFKRHKEEYVLIVYLRHELSRDVILRQCALMLNSTNTIIAAGRQYHDVYGIGKSYCDAVRALDSRSAVLRDEEVYDAEYDYPYVGYELPSNIESMLYNYIISGNSQLVMETIKNSLKNNLDREISFKEYLQLIDVFELYLTRVYENMDVSAREKIKYSAYSGAALSAEAVESRVKIMLENYEAITEFYDGEMHTDMMKNILKYIENNIERDIGLDDIASAVNLTPNYITKYFKSKNYINFKSYLTIKRIDKARELLTETCMAVKDIATRCGYNSSKQLIVNFSKLTGITPTEYRKRNV